jgi:hypothetical protein
VSAPRPSKPERGTFVGTGPVADQIVLQGIYSRGQIDEKTRQVIQRNLGEILPGNIVKPGGTASERPIGAADFATLVRAAAVGAAGLDPAKTSEPPPPVLWEGAGGRLLVLLATITAATNDGIIDIVIPVTSDQTGDTTVTVTFITGTPDRPTGGLTTTEDHPRGPAVIVESWHEQLVAFAWKVVLAATAAVAGVGGSDQAGSPLIANTVYATKAGVSVVPMARHTFFGNGSLR